MTVGKSLKLRILSPEGLILEVDEATGINVPLVDGGGIGIRPGHAALIAETIQGFIRYRTSGGESQIEISAGILDISDNVVTILTAHEISEDPVETESKEINAFPELIQTISQELYPEEKSVLDRAAS